MNKDKLVLPITILLGCIILGGFFYASQLSKQKSIEKQQQIELQAKVETDRTKVEADQVKTEQDKKEYTAKRKKDCYDIKQREDENSIYVVTDSFYNKEKDVCEIEYKVRNQETGDITYFIKEF